MIIYIILALNIAIIALLVVYRKRLRIINEVMYKQLLVTFGLLLAIAISNVLSIGIFENASNVSNRDIIILADISHSMNAVDGRNGNESTRIEDMREDIINIITDNQGAAISIHEMGYTNHVVTPLNTNLEHLTEATNTLYSPDTDSPLKNITSYKDAFEYIGEYLKKQHDFDPTRERILITMSDFEIYKDQENQDDIKSAYQNLKQYAGGFVNIVYGKDEGANILYMTYDYVNNKTVPAYIYYQESDSIFSSLLDLKYIEEPYGEPVTSKPNVELATTLTKANSGQLLRSNAPDDYKQAIAKSATSAYRKAASNPESQAIRQNWLYAPLALILFLWIIICEVIKPQWLKKIMTGNRNNP
ncbi:VWA domain-containing protein [Candidatus Saccharibacteria bacterium]|nr:VWA domain-containing protein [Candidatus Saccharibacteria bacterium]